MPFLADFHIHSKYSRATSREMNPDRIADFAKLKGIDLMGTGDFTHHLWLEELKSKIKPEKNGLFTYKGIRFILSAEVSSIYSKNNRTYRIHNVILAPSFKAVDKINSVLSRCGNIASDGRPILGLDAKEVARIVFEADPNCMLIPGHIWTPWFSLFGSMSGFDRIEDCFEEYTDKIFALETGLSSDPSMNWRLSKLDRFSLVSNSDSHSPQKIGREANAFDCKLDYYEIRETLKKKDKNKFLYTIEFFPEEGKYHFDGHRNCNVRFSPKETKKNKNICPECGKSLTVGVMHRVDDLADREDGYKPNNAIPYKNLIQLDEIIADAKGVGKSSKTVLNEYAQIVSRLGTEFNALVNASEEELTKNVSRRIVEGIMRVRNGRVIINPGYDGEYGTIKIFSEEERKEKRRSAPIFLI